MWKPLHIYGQLTRKDYHSHSCLWSESSYTLSLSLSPSFPSVSVAAVTPMNQSSVSIWSVGWRSVMTTVKHQIGFTATQRSVQSATPPLRRTAAVITWSVAHVRQSSAGSARDLGNLMDQAGESCDPMQRHYANIEMWNLQHLIMSENVTFLLY